MHQLNIRCVEMNDIKPKLRL